MNNSTKLLNEIFDKMLDKESGLLTFEGEKSPPWDKNKFLAFKLNPDVEELKAFRSTLYFDLTTKDLKWFVFEAEPMALEVLDGFEEREYEDEDFVIEGCTDTDAPEYQYKWNHIPF